MNTDTPQNQTSGKFLKPIHLKVNKIRIKALVAQLDRATAF